MPRTQQERAVRFTGPLAEDKLLFYKMSGGEELSRAFQFNIELP